MFDEATLKARINNMRENHEFLECGLDLAITKYKAHRYLEGDTFPAEFEDGLSDEFKSMVRDGVAPTLDVIIREDTDIVGRFVLSMMFYHGLTVAEDFLTAGIDPEYREEAEIYLDTVVEGIKDDETRPVTFFFSALTLVMGRPPSTSLLLQVPSRVKSEEFDSDELRDDGFMELFESLIHNHEADFRAPKTFAHFNF